MKPVEDVWSALTAGYSDFDGLVSVFAALESLVDVALLPSDSLDDDVLPLPDSLDDDVLLLPDSLDDVVLLLPDALGDDEDFASAAASVFLLLA